MAKIEISPCGYLTKTTGVGEVEWKASTDPHGHPTLSDYPPIYYGTMSTVTAPTKDSPVPAKPVPRVGDLIALVSGTQAEVTNFHGRFIYAIVLPDRVNEVRRCATEVTILSRKAPTSEAEKREYLKPGVTWRDNDGTGDEWRLKREEVKRFSTQPVLAVGWWAQPTNNGGLPHEEYWESVTCLLDDSTPIRDEFGIPIGEPKKEEGMKPEELALARMGQTSHVEGDWSKPTLKVGDVVQLKDVPVGARFSVGNRRDCLRLSPEDAKALGFQSRWPDCQQFTFMLGSMLDAFTDASSNFQCTILSLPEPTAPIGKCCTGCGRDRIACSPKCRECMDADPGETRTYGSKAPAYSRYAVTYDSGETVVAKVYSESELDAKALRAAKAYSDSPATVRLGSVEYERLERAKPVVRVREDAPPPDPRRFITKSDTEGIESNFESEGVDLDTRIECAQPYKWDEERDLRYIRARHMFDARLAAKDGPGIPCIAEGVSR